MNENIEKPTFKQIVLLNLQQLTNFPYIEKDFDALTDYGLLCKVVDKMNKVITNNNIQNESINKLYNAFIELKDYVDNYFNNLDVQEEINNKLEEMALNGELTNLIKLYVDPIYESYEEFINNKILSLEDKINNVVSGSPLTASSVDGMTDTTRIYVNTTNGHWYYYNGTAWEDGGVYQSTGLSANSVSYYEISPLLKNTNIIKKLQPSDLIWLEGLSRFNGGTVTDAAATSSQCFKISKNTNILISDETIRVRYTFYDLNGIYISNTGTFRNIPSYNVKDDCYCVITYAGSLEDALYNSISFEGIKNNNIDLNFNYYFTYTNKFESDVVYLEKGTIVKLSDFGKYNSSSTLTNATAYLGINKYGKDKKSHNYVNFGLDTMYSANTITIDESSYYRFYIRLNGNKSLPEEHLSRLTNLFEIIPTNYESYNMINNNLYRTYISNNGDIELIEDGQYVYFRVINPSNGLVIKEDANTIYDVPFTTMLETLSTYDVEYNGYHYLRLSQQNVLYYDLFSNSLKITNMNSNPIGVGSSVLLLANGYGNIIPCDLLMIYLKKQIGGSNIFNSVNYLKASSWVSKCQEFSNVLKNASDNIEAFTFFTDPHIMGFSSTDYNPNLNIYIGTLQKVYNSTPMSYIVSGGDWINSGDTPERASFKLGYVYGIMKTMFNNSHLVVGNHDLNFLGTEALTTNQLKKLWFLDKEKTYYKFNGNNSLNYVIDTGVEHNSMTSYDWEQVNWLATQLISDDPTHGVIFAHILWQLPTDTDLKPLANNLTLLINAYNSHTTVTLNEVNYDFTNCTGHIDYILGGHLHSDKSGIVNNVLCIVTTTFSTNYGVGTPTFDLILNDYDNHVAKFIRYGTGENREFTI